MIAASEFQRRRKQLMRIITRDAIAILPAAPERIRNNDAHYPYRQDSDFHYLTGFDEAHAVLVLVPGRKAGEIILFCRERDVERERWDGGRLGPERAVEHLGIDDAFPIDDIDDILPGLIEGRDRVYYHFGREIEFDQKLIGWVNRVRAQVRQGAHPPYEFVALSHVLHDLRLFKSRTELRVMAKSAQIAADAHMRAMRATRAGSNEALIAAELIHAFHTNQAVPSYEPIVGGGANACVLHYRANNAALKDGDLLLVDAGAEFHCYASDITRTWPISGRYSAAQRALYELVLEAQFHAIDEARPGRPFTAMHDAAVRTLTRGLIRLGLLEGSLEANLKAGTYKRFYMHKTGHWLGLDVHDVGDYKIDGEARVLEPGMVVTVEPGLYIAADETGIDAKWKGIGIRIEDDVVITANDPDILSHGVPKEAAAIEEILANR